MAILFLYFLAFILQVWAHPPATLNNVHCEPFKVNGKRNVQPYHVYVRCKINEDYSVRKPKIVFNNQYPKETKYIEMTGNIEFNISKSYNFKRFHSLEKLSIRNAESVQIQPNALDNLKSLRSIYIKNNKNVHLSKIQLRNLKELKISDNQRVSLPNDFFKGITQLKVLSLYNNNLASLNSEIFDDLKSLRKLDLSHNQFNELPDYLFTELKNLKYLNLRENRLRAILATTFNGPVNLRELDLRNNQLGTVPNNLINGFRDGACIRFDGNPLKRKLGTVTIKGQGRYFVME